MEYGNIDEATRREACEKVKKIAEAIKKIRKKYYLCFDRISDDDKQKYNILKTQMQSVADENGLNKLYAELIGDIEGQYDEKLPEDMDENGMPSRNSIEKAYQMYIKATQLLSEFVVQLRNTLEQPRIAKACMKRILKIQEYTKKLKEYLKKSYSESNLNNVKRNILSDKFAQFSKEYMDKLFENSYKNANDPLIKKDIINNLNSKQNEMELIK